jgi:Flp pilus assembly protein TadB
MLTCLKNPVLFQEKLAHNAKTLYDLSRNKNQVRNKTVKKVIVISILALLFINFVLGHIILFVVNNFFPILMFVVAGVFLLKRHDRKHSGSKK